MIEITSYWESLVAVATISVFMAISPGADFAMVTRNSIFHSRRAGLFSALGVSLAIWIHVAYSIAGLAVIISNSIVLFSIIKYMGAAYLIYIGWQTFRTQPENADARDDCSVPLSAFGALKIGFVTNALNPKTTVFFMSIFTQVVEPGTPVSVQVVFGAIISMAHLLWFSLVAVMLTRPVLLRKFKHYRRAIERVVGSILMGFGLKVATATTE